MEERWAEYYNKTLDDKIESFPISKAKDNEKLYNYVWVVTRDVDDLSKLKTEPQSMMQVASLNKTFKRGNVLILAGKIADVLEEIIKAKDAILNGRDEADLKGDEVLQYEMIMDFGDEFNTLYQNINGALREFEWYNNQR